MDVLIIGAAGMIGRKLARALATSGAVNGRPIRRMVLADIAVPDAPVMDFVFTVCDDAAGEICPVWPGHPVTAHWGIEDPSLVQGNDIERERAFVTALRYLENLIRLFIALPIERLEAAALTAKLQEIGQNEGASHRRGDAA